MKKLNQWGWGKLRWPLSLLNNFVKLLLQSDYWLLSSNGLSSDRLGLCVGVCVKLGRYPRLHACGVWW